MVRMLRRNRIRWILSMLFVVLFAAPLFPRDTFAQGAPGTIKGTVRDRESGDKLDYANVLLVGTTRGTMSLGGGVFYFNGMAPGTYTIKVLYLGYAPQEQTVTVQPGQTANLSFDLETVIVEQLQAFDVEGEEYMVEVKSAVTEHKVSSETFQKYAIDSVEDALAKQAGVVSRAGELYVRGGRSGEVKYQMDGVSVNNPLGGGHLEVSTLSVENTTMATGGLDAKYGNALSGVVNITTKEGGEKFGGGLRFLTNDFGRQDKTFTNFDRFEYGFGGPTPGQGSDLLRLGRPAVLRHREHLASRTVDEHKVNDRRHSTLFKFRRRQTNSAKGSIKLAYTLNQNMKVTGEYTYSDLAEREVRAQLGACEGYRQAPAVHAARSSTCPALQGQWLVLRTQHRAGLLRSLVRQHAEQRRAPLMVIDYAQLQQPPSCRCPVLEVRSAADNQIYHGRGPRGIRRVATIPIPRTRPWREDSSYVEFNAADQQPGVLHEHRPGGQDRLAAQHLTESTFYTVRLGLVAFDSRYDVDGKDPVGLYSHGGIRSPGAVHRPGPATYSRTATSDYYTDPLSSYFVTTSSDNFVLPCEEYSRSYSLGFELVSNRNEWAGHLIESGFRITYNDLERYALVSAGASCVRSQLHRRMVAGRRTATSSTPTTRKPAGTCRTAGSTRAWLSAPACAGRCSHPVRRARSRLDNEAVDRNVTQYKTAFHAASGLRLPDHRARRLPLPLRTLRAVPRPRVPVR